MKTIAYDNDGRATTSTTVSVDIIPLKLDFMGFNNLGAPMLQTRIPNWRSYTVSYTDDFVTWIPLQTNTADGLILNLQDLGADGSRFYRLMVQP